MSLEKIINDAWENKDQVSPNSDQSLKDAINQVISDLAVSYTHLTLPTKA